MRPVLQALLFTAISAATFIHAVAKGRRNERDHGVQAIEDMLGPPSVLLDLMVWMLPRTLRRWWAASLMMWCSMLFIAVHLSFLIYASLLPHIRVLDWLLYAVCLVLLSSAGTDLARFMPPARTRTVP